MFESLFQNLDSIFRRIRGRGKLSESNTREAMREIRVALLEADVSYKVVKEFTENVMVRALGHEVVRSVSPGQQIVKIVHDELVKLMGPVDHTIPFVEGGVTAVMLVGLQGSGKTTTAAKLAKYLFGKGRKPLLVAADVQRPAAIDQLEILGREAEIPVFAQRDGRPPRICQRAVEYAAENNLNVAILDTAGRLHIDEDLMAELKEIQQRVKPQQLLFVCDAMTGQDAVRSAEEFDRRLSLDGVILTKLDGDARGGAALSVKAVTGKPIKFIGVGERLDRLEEFHPDRMASRILGMGDVVTLVEKAQAAVDRQAAESLEEKIRKDTLSLEDFLGQLQQVKKLGPLRDILSMLPGMSAREEEMDIAQEQIPVIEAIIRSMTPGERRNPDVIDGSRRRRIAAGSGTQPQDVNQLLKQFRQMKKIMKQWGGRGGRGAGGAAGAPAIIRPGGPRVSGTGRHTRSKRKKKRRR